MFFCNYCSNKFSSHKGLRLHQHNCLYIQLDKLSSKKQSTTSAISSQSFVSPTVEICDSRKSQHNNNNIDYGHHLNDNSSEPFFGNETSDTKNLTNLFGSDGNDTNAEYRVCVELFAICQNANVPIYFYDKILEWARRANCFYNYKFVPKDSPISRAKAMTIINKRFNMYDIHPKCTKIFLQGYNDSVDIIWHDFESNLYSLLNDKELMSPDNLLLDNHSFHNVLNDINTGSVFHNAKKIYIKNKDTELLVPIIFFTDKTHTDINGRLCAEPIQFTLGIFNRKTRDNSLAWRTLGYVNDLTYKGQIATKAKMNDYHRIMDVILDSYKQCLKKDISYNFGVNGETKMMILKMPTLFIIGDTEGHDKLCGRMACRHNIQHLCRYCNTDRDDTDNPFVKYNFTKMNDVKKLILNENENALKSMSMFCVKNAWHDIPFCDPTRGLHGALNAELLHTLQQGIFEYAITNLFSIKKTSKKAILTKKRKLIVLQKKTIYKQSHVTIII